MLCQLFSGIFDAWEQRKNNMVKSDVHKPVAYAKAVEKLAKMFTAEINLDPIDVPNHVHIVDGQSFVTVMISI